LVVAVIRNWDKIKELFSKAWEWLKSNAGTILAIITGPFGLAVLAITKNWDKIKETASRLWQSIKNVFSGVTGFFSNIWTTIKNKFTSVGSTIGDAIGGAFKSVVNALLGFAENKINGFIRLINGAINMVNKMPGVSIGKLTEMSVPRMARGGVIDGATLAVVGEAGKEAVVPLENNTGWIDMIASKLDGAMGGSGQPVHVTVNIGEDTVIEKVIEGIKNQEFRTNQGVFI